MENRPIQAKDDGLARKLIEPIASTLIKTRLALLPNDNRSEIKIEDIFLGLNIADFQRLSSSQENLVKTDDEKTFNNLDGKQHKSFTNLDICESTIEQWLFMILNSSSTIRKIFSTTDEILTENWFKLHEQLGLPSLLPLYFFIIHVLLDVINEYLEINREPRINDDIADLDSLDRQQVN